MDHKHTRLSALGPDVEPEFNALKSAAEKIAAIAAAIGTMEVSHSVEVDGKTYIIWIRQLG